MKVKWNNAGMFVVTDLYQTQRQRCEASKKSQPTVLYMPVLCNAQAGKSMD